MTCQVQNILIENSDTRTNGGGDNVCANLGILLKNRPRHCKPTDTAEIRALFELLYIRRNLADVAVKFRGYICV